MDGWMDGCIYPTTRAKGFRDEYEATASAFCDPDILILNPEVGTTNTHKHTNTYAHTRAYTDTHTHIHICLGIDAEHRNLCLRLPQT